MDDEPEYEVEFELGLCAIGFILSVVFALGVLTGLAF